MCGICVYPTYKLLPRHSRTKVHEQSKSKSICKKIVWKTSFDSVFFFLYIWGIWYFVCRYLLHIYLQDTSIQYDYIIEATISYYPIPNGWKLWYGKFGLFYTKSLVNTNSFYTNFTNTYFQKVPIPHLTRTMKQKFLH